MNFLENANRCFFVFITFLLHLNLVRVNTKLFLNHVWPQVISNCVDMRPISRLLIGVQQAFMNNFCGVFVLQYDVNTRKQISVVLISVKALTFPNFPSLISHSPQIIYQ